MAEFQKVKKVLIITLLLNWLVALAKIAIGFLTGAISILADGFHSLFDGVSNVIGLFGIKAAEKPKDASHPYGHHKFEAMAALGVAFLILITAYEFLKGAIERFLQPVVPNITLLSFLVMGAAVAIDCSVYLYESRQGKKLKSIILAADAIHTKTHLFTTPSVILGMVAIKMGYYVFDPIITLLVIIMLGKLAWEVVRHTTDVLCDRAFIGGEKIQKIAAVIPGIESSHQIRTRGSEQCIFLDMHITLNPNMSLKEAHNVSHQLKEKIMKDIPQVKDAVIHIEPKR